MLKIHRAGAGWFTTIDPSNGEQVCIHIDALRQEARSGIDASAYVVAMSSFRRKAPVDGEVVKITDDDLKKAKQYKFKNDTEIVFLMDYDAGANPARIFDRLTGILANVILGLHEPMDYSSYLKHLGFEGKLKGSYTYGPMTQSPTNMVAVWDMIFMRVYGIEDGLFSILQTKATLLAGWMGSSEVVPGGLYNFPEGFRLETDVESADYLAVLQQCLDKAMNGDFAARVEKYYTP